MEVLEPVTRHELLMTGCLATLLGMDLSTDGFRDPTQRVLPRGAMFTYATPEYLGAYSTRGAPTAEPTTGVNEGNTDKGWLVSETLSFVLANWLPRVSGPTRMKLSASLVVMSLLALRSGRHREVAELMTQASVSSDCEELCVPRSCKTTVLQCR